LFLDQDGGAGLAGFIDIRQELIDPGGKVFLRNLAGGLSGEALSNH
jgi:hypothetical protein